jgi:PAS domain S-box-containing protein
MADQLHFDRHLSDRRFQLLIEAVTDYAIYMLEPTGHIATWNPGARRFKGYEAEEIIGRHFSTFFTEEDRASDLPGRILRTAAEDGRFEAEGWRVRKDGTRFWAQVMVDPIRAETGELLGFAKITRDITDKKRAQDELEEARAALFQSQKLQALGELTGGIAHDFNNLITVVRGSAEMLKRSDLTPEKRDRYLDAIIETAERATALTSHLLAFGRRQALKPQVIDLNVRFDALADVLGRMLGSHIAVKLDLARDLWLVEADPAQLESALLNAAINARDAMPDGGSLTLSTANCTEAGEVCIAVADTGEGMAPEILSRAFEPFFTTKSVGKGTGLGLSQIHGFAAQTGGRAEIESTPGEGTIVRLYLPRTERPLAAVDEGRSTPAGVAGKTVLLVEDNDLVRSFADGLLADLGYDVVSTGSADEALARLAEGKVDLVLTDIVMPGTSGIELARRVNAERPGLPVLLATGYSDELVKGAAAEFQVIAKPYGPVELAEAVAAALGGRA